MLLIILAEGAPGCYGANNVKQVRLTLALGYIAPKKEERLTYGHPYLRIWLLKKRDPMGSLLNFTKLTTVQQCTTPDVNEVENF